MSDGSFPTRWRLSRTSDNAAETEALSPTPSLNQTSNSQAIAATALQGQISTFNATNSTFNHIGRDQVNITNIYYGTPTPNGGTGELSDISAMIDGPNWTRRL
jgi:hypothetical protein